jgi:hypothetical protein
LRDQTPITLMRDRQLEKCSMAVAENRFTLFGAMLYAGIAEATIPAHLLFCLPTDWSDAR